MARNLSPAAAPSPRPAAAAPATRAAPAPLAVVSCEAARANRKANRWSGWAAREQGANKADPDFASHRIWKSLPELGIRPKFTISARDKVFAMGSCFAREVEDALAALGFDVPTRCDALFDRELMRPPGAAAGQRPRAYLNRYNSMSLRDELTHLLGLDPALEQGLLTYPLEQGMTADLHYTQSLAQTNPVGTVERRRIVREHLGPRLRECRVFVVTLGMAECWFDREAQRYLNNTPGPRVMAMYGAQLEVHMTRFAQHLEALEQAHATLSGSLGDNIRVVVTVSPVPLELSFQDRDVVATNLYSKAMLRAVAEEFAAGHANVDYFPSYEFVSVATPDTAWAWDYRHVKPNLVGHIMKAFRTHYVR
jgi:hypothetical protein